MATAPIEKYLRSLERFSARALVMRSDEQVLLRFPSGDRHASQRTSHDKLRGLIRGVAPEAASDALEKGIEAEFDYAFDGRSYSFRVSPGGASWTVVIEPAPEDQELEPGAFEDLDEEPTQVKDEGAEEKPDTRTKKRDRAPEVEEEPESWIVRLLTLAAREGASDLHLVTGAKPYLRVHGELRVLESYETLEGGWLFKQLLDIAPDKKRSEIRDKLDTDFSYHVPEVGRYRIHWYTARSGPGAAIRPVPPSAPDAAELEIPKAALDLLEARSGLLVVSGPGGSGKSTTLAACVEHLNAHRSARIVTIEEPIEFVYEQDQCLISQREIGTTAASWRRALLAALRQDPDVVVLGDLRGAEAIALALEAADTGHLVLAGARGRGAPDTLERIADAFPPDRAEQVRRLLARTLRGVVSQVLCRRKEGGRVAAYEVLLSTGEVENLIREERTSKLLSTMESGRRHGMQTLSDSLVSLVKEGHIELGEALRHAPNPAELEGQLA